MLEWTLGCTGLTPLSACVRVHATRMRTPPRGNVRSGGEDPDVADPGSGARVKSVEAGKDDDTPGLVVALGLEQGAPPAILVCGGAKLGAKDEQRCHEVLGPAVRDAAFAARAVVVDGATNAGVMRVVGQARAAPLRDPVLVGVAPRSKVALPGEDREA